MNKTVLERTLSFVIALLMVITILPASVNEVQAAAYTGCLSQHDSRWGSLSYGGGTISATGCGILSLVNTVGYLSGEMMDIPSVASWAHSVRGFNVNGPEGVWRLDLYPLVEAKYGAKYGITVDCGPDGDSYWEGSSSTRLKNHLLKGGVAIGHVPGHFISIVGYNANTNMFHIYDSSATSLRGTNYNGGDVWVTQAALATNRLCLDWFCLLSSTKKQETWVERAAFDVMVYRDRNPDLAGKTDSQLKEHWLNFGIKEGRPSSVVLDLKFYVNNNPDLKAAFGTDYAAAYHHFITTGYKEGRKSSALFDGNYYTQKYTDVATNFKEEYMRHYVENGIFEGRRASLTFDPDYYWFIRPDVNEAWPGDYAMCARHYAGHGINAQIEAYDHENPVITDATVSDITAQGYTVTCKVTDNWAISKVVFPTWTAANDQDDLADNFMNTQKGTKSGDTYTFRVNASDHNNEGGAYITHIYAIDKGGNQVQLVLPAVEVKDPVEEKITLLPNARLITEETQIQNVKNGTTVQTLLSQFVNENLQVRNCNDEVISGSDVVGTGTTVNLYIDGEIVDSLEVVVLADVDGSGYVDTTDYLRIKAAFLETLGLTQAQSSAADLDGNGVVDTTDYMIMKSYFLGQSGLSD